MKDGCHGLYDFYRKGKLKSVPYPIPVTSKEKTKHNEQMTTAQHVAWRQKDVLMSEMFVMNTATPQEVLSSLVRHLTVKPEQRF